MCKRIRLQQHYSWKNRWKTLYTEMDGRAFSGKTFSEWIAGIEDDRLKKFWPAARTVDKVWDEPENQTGERGRRWRSFWKRSTKSGAPVTSFEQVHVAAKFAK